MTIKERRALWKVQGLCQDCGTTPSGGYFRCSECTARHKLENRKYQDLGDGRTVRQQQHQSNRLAALTHYGLACVCCGEAEQRFLSLDHVNNDGYLHRAVIRKDIYRWARENHYPGTLQTLCYNCNLGKAHNGGTCPHQAAGGNPWNLATPATT